MNKDNANILLTPASVGEIVLYQPNDSVKLEVRLENETVWLTQSQMAELFSVKVPAVSKHIKNIFDEGELEVISTVSKMEIVRQGGKQRSQKFYRLLEFTCFLKTTVEVVISLLGRFALRL